MSSKEGSKDEEKAVSESSLSGSFTDANIKIEPSDNFLQVICKLEESTVSQASSEESHSLIDADSRETPEELMIIPPTEIEEIYFNDHLDNFSSISIRSVNHQYAPNIFTMCRYFVKKKLPLPHTHQVLVSQTNGGTIKQENEEQNPGEFEVDKNIGAVGDNSPLLGFEVLSCEDHNEAKIRQDSLKGNTPEHLNSPKIFAALKVKKHLEILDSSTIKQNEASISYEKEEKTLSNERSNYLLHLRTKSCSPVHCKDSPFSCDQCKQDFSKKMYVLSHMRSMGTDKGAWNRHKYTDKGAWNRHRYTDKGAWNRHEYTDKEA
uniref:C2H2-type domain-containing protein n=1 Tax=Timema tahoe TaxID=61484 RepID=A0A7R9NXB1_9NEOP|nr:unnamed protein product [Timema tahoe]